ncbi:hypothetical protein N7478_011315 [Penicillium angulare]|uniref:uncharacterized protein n=1 Tax=Penicillium angulare TaxID=116970 RepID=UPI002540BDAC|nr:uncharacterized protein N7478_011315 [Penicillium angulare]KAJ5263710.1 hypothetical protein N7478_011315 [Penicillium angulare]
MMWDIARLLSPGVSPFGSDINPPGLLEILLSIFTFALQSENDEPDQNEYYLRIPSSPEKIRNLLNFCLVSQRFRDMTQPLLFRTVVENSETVLKTMSFIRTLCLRPDLGQHVQNLYVVPSDKTWNLFPKPFSFEDQAIVKALIEDHQLDDGHQGWLSALPYIPFMNFYMALAAILTPNVTQLFVSGSTPPTPYVNASKQFPAYLSKVTQLNIINHHRHPILRGIYFSHKDFFGEHFWEPGTLNPERIELHQCYMDNNFLRMFIRAHKNIKAFKYSTFEHNPRIFRPGAPIYGPRIQFNAAQALEALSVHKSSLTSFQVEFERKEGFWDHHLKTFNSNQIKFGSFRQFVKLKSIIVGHEYLPNHPEFNASLETLSINDCNVLNLPIQDLLCNIANDYRKGLYPNLNLIQITGYEIEPNPVSAPDGQYRSFPKSRDEALMVIQSFFEGCNVRIQITTAEPAWFNQQALIRMPQ